MVVSVRTGKAHAKLKRLAAARAPGRKPTAKDLDTSFEKAAALLKGAGEHARFQVRLIGPRKTASWCFTLAEGTCTVGRARVDRPEIEIITGEDTYWELATGNSSPVEAFLGGKMEVIGDCNLLRRIFKKLATRGDTYFPTFFKEVT